MASLSNLPKNDSLPAEQLPEFSCKQVDFPSKIPFSFRCRLLWYKLPTMASYLKFGSTGICYVECYVAGVFRRAGAGQKEGYRLLETISFSFKGLLENFLRYFLGPTIFFPP